MYFLIDQYRFCTTNWHVHHDQYGENGFHLSQDLVRSCHILSEGTFFLTRPVYRVTNNEKGQECVWIQLPLNFELIKQYYQPPPPPPP